MEQLAVLPLELNDLAAIFRQNAQTVIDKQSAASQIVSGEEKLSDGMPLCPGVRRKHKEIMRRQILRSALRKRVIVGLSPGEHITNFLQRRFRLFKRAEAKTISSGCVRAMRKPANPVPFGSFLFREHNHDFQLVSGVRRRQLDQDISHKLKLCGTLADDSGMPAGKEIANDRSVCDRRAVFRDLGRLLLQFPLLQDDLRLLETSLVHSGDRSRSDPCGHEIIV